VALLTDFSIEVVMGEYLLFREMEIGNRVIVE
jgi:hypothetical protein